MAKLVVCAPFFNQTKKSLQEYFSILGDSAVDEVLLRDVSCQKREPTVGFYKKAIKTLQNCGKKVILNTPLIVRKKDKAFHALLPLSDAVEVNNIGYLRFLNGKETILGPQLKLYNPMDANLFEEFGFTRFVVPYLATRKKTKDLLRGISGAGEVFVFGVEPVALSWNCFLASFFGRNRINCQRTCFNYPTGLNLSSLNHLPLFRATGVEMQSQKAYSILQQVEYLKRLGVKHFRVNPHLVFEKSELKNKLVLLKGIIEGRRDPESFWWLEKCNGTFFEKTPGYEYVSEEDAQKKNILQTGKRAAKAWD